jgi:Flp pilus assembly secretin CpaC
VVVTPYIAAPVTDPSSLHLPGEDTSPPNDLERILKLRQVASGSARPPTRLAGQAGFIVQ